MGYRWVRVQLLLIAGIVLPAIAACGLLGLGPGTGDGSDPPAGRPEEVCSAFAVTGPVVGREPPEGLIEFSFICGASERTATVFVSRTESPFADPQAFQAEITTDRDRAARVSLPLVRGAYFWGVESCSGGICVRFPEEGAFALTVRARLEAPGDLNATLSCAIGPVPLRPTFAWSTQTEGTHMFVLVAGPGDSDLLAATNHIFTVPAVQQQPLRAPLQGSLVSPFTYEPGETRLWGLWLVTPSGRVLVSRQLGELIATANPPRLLEPADLAELAGPDVELRWDADIADDPPNASQQVFLARCDQADSLFEIEPMASGLPAGANSFQATGLDVGCWAWGVAVVDDAGVVADHRLRACPDCCETVRTFNIIEDCNGNGVSDATDIANGASRDCQDDGTPDECQLSGNDCNRNRRPDECDRDCNDNGTPDDCEDLSENDCNENGIPDECEEDCNGNGIADDCELGENDCNENNIPDDCEPDCNGNRFPDDCDISFEVSQDLNENGIPDECERLHVNRFVQIPGDGRTWDTAFVYLQDALRAAATPGGTNSTIAIREIWVSAADGVPYRPDESSFGGDVEPRGAGFGDRTATFHLLNNVAIYGGFCGGELRLDQRDCGHTVLSGDLFQDDDFEGGPINRGDNSLHVVTASGTNATALLEGFVIEAGFADGFGQDGSGAGLFSAGGSATVRRCRFHGNMARERGAGVYLDGGGLRLSNVLFAGNSAGLNDETDLGEGGAMAAVNGSAPVLVNCTLTQNGAFCGGGIFAEDSVPVVLNSIIWGNGFGGICLSDFGTTDVVARFSDIELGVDGVWPGLGNLNVDPEFATPCCGASVNARLCEFSFCVDAGNNADVDSTFDLDGLFRISTANPEVGPRVDMGAYEGFVICSE